VSRGRERCGRQARFSELQQSTEEVGRRCLAGGWVLGAAAPSPIAGSNIGEPEDRPCSRYPTRSFDVDPGHVGHIICCREPRYLPIVVWLNCVRGRMAAWARARTTSRPARGLQVGRGGERCAWTVILSLTVCVWGGDSRVSPAQPQATDRRPQGLRFPRHTPRLPRDCSQLELRKVPC